MRTISNIPIASGLQHFPSTGILFTPSPQAQTDPIAIPHNAPPPECEVPFDLQGQAIAQEQSADRNATRGYITTEIEGKLYRVKQDKYGATHVFYEWLALEFIRLTTGLPAPKVRLVKGTHTNFAHEQRRDAHLLEPKDCLCVASRMEPSFIDLGSFLVNDNSKRKGIDYVKAEDQARYRELLVEYQTASDEESRLRNDSGIAKLLACKPPLSQEAQASLSPLHDAILRQLNAKIAMYRLLPQVFHDAIKLAYCAAQLVNNWDLFNFSLFNTGFVFDDNGQLKGPMTVDGGNCLDNGFGGNRKMESLDAAQQPAKSSDPLRPHARLCPPDLELGAVWSAAPWTNMSRTRPYDDIIDFKSLVTTETSRADAVLAGRKWLNENQPPPGFDPMLEFAYRLSLLPNNAIEQFAERYWIIGKDPSLPLDGYDLTAANGKMNKEEFVKQMKARVQSMIGQFTEKQLQHWAELNYPRAVLARSEITRCMAELFSSSPTNTPAELEEATEASQHDVLAPTRRTTEYTDDESTRSISISTSIVDINDTEASPFSRVSSMPNLLVDSGLISTIPRTNSVYEFFLPDTHGGMPDDLRK